MNRMARLNSLLEILARDGRVSVEEAAERVGVSAATIRRDLDQLAQQQLLTRTRGGAVVNGVSYDLPLRYKTAKHAPEKQRIGSAAASLVPPGSVVGLNGGTTTTEVARVLATRADLSSTATGPALTVVTNALNIANELTVRPHVKIVLTGGVARPQSYELIGPLASAMLTNLSLDVAILGVDAIDVRTGASAHHEGEASINQLMASRARQVMVVADGSKLGQRAFAQICPIEDIDIVVTDSGAPLEADADFANAGVRLVRA
ncbi:MAG: DeoR/GlpR family DNA-binding transcription regulator [Actinomycetes bacterium]